MCYDFQDGVNNEGQEEEEEEEEGGKERGR